MSATGVDPPYLMGRDDRETQRLIAVAEVLNPPTRAMLRGAGPDSIAPQWLAESVRSMLPLIVRFGVATEEEVDVDSLADRLRAATAAVVGKGPDLVCAWTRT
jgi:hypothetical protein